MEHEKIRLLLVEDDRVDQMAFERAMRDEKDRLRYRIAGTLEEAFVLLSTDEFDIVVTDFNLGEATAFDLLEKIKDLPVIVTTGQGNEEIAVRAMRGGAYDYLIKDPARNYLKVLIPSVDKAVSFARATRERDELFGMLAEKKEELDTVLSSVAEGILSLDSELNVTLVNPAFLKIIERNADEIVGKSMYAICSRADADKGGKEEEISLLKQTLQTGAVTSGRAEIITGEGHAVTIQFINSPLRDHRGRVIGVVKTVRDISREAEIDRMKNDFISTVSHELRTPLTSIKGYIDIILDGDTGPINETQKEFLGIVVRNANRLGELINDLLDVEKIESGKIEMTMTRVRLQPLLKMAAETMRAMAEQRSLELVLESESDMFIFADEDRIMQALMNLLSNSIKFTASGRVTLGMKKNGEYAEIYVCDTGIGISQTDQEKLFTKFFRADDDYVRQAGGTGLGLSIVKAIVEKHGGEISVESEIGKGTCFRFLIPLISEPDSNFDRQNPTQPN